MKDTEIPNVIGINRREVFTLEEARELLPIVFRITKTYATKVQTLIERLEGLGNHNERVVSALEDEVSLLIQEWQNKVQKLGALPKGLWIADFDSGDGYFCWKYPERSIEYWHHYSDGYSKRVAVSERHRPVSLQERLRKKIFELTPAAARPRPAQGSRSSMLLIPFNPSMD